MTGRKKLGVWQIPTYIAPLMKASQQVFVSLVLTFVVWYGCDGIGTEPTEDVPLLSDPQTSFDDYTDRFYTAVTVTLSSEEAGIDTIWSEMYLETGVLADSLGTDTLMAATALYDDATNGDILPLDGIYAGEFDSPLPAGSGGSVRFEFYALVNGDTSNISYILRLANLRPVIVSVSAADTLKLPSEGAHTLDTVRVEVTDPDGLVDIRTVEFTSLKPDTTLANNGDPLSLADNGDMVGWGDAEARDGIYSRITPLPSDALLGSYLYKFIAKDYSGAVSDTVEHTLVVVE